MGCFLNSKVDNANDHTVKTKDGHRANGDIHDKLQSYSVDAMEQTDDCDDRNEIHDEIKRDMDDDLVFVNMPIENNQTQCKGRKPSNEVFLEVCFFEPSRFSDQMSHEEETDTTNKPVECEIGGEMVILVGAI